MNKIKTVSKLGIAQLVIKSLKGQQLSENEVFAINSNRVDGLLHLDVIRKGPNFKLVYNITGFITLQEYLATPLNRERFGRTLQNILANLQAVERVFFNHEGLLMELGKVMVNPATQRIHFIYVPIPYFNSGTPLREFLLSIIQNASFVSDEDTDYVREYISILNSGVNFSVFDLEQYVGRLTGKELVKRGPAECPKCRSPLRPNTKYCTLCGCKIMAAEPTAAAGKKTTYDPLERPMRDNSPAADTDDWLQPEKRGTYPPTEGLSDRAHKMSGGCGGTTVLGQDDDGSSGTTVLGGELTPRRAFLLRERSGERIPVTKLSFRIGKERKCSDYFVSDNNAVSRSHADIVTRGTRSFIVDHNSTNKTYVDGRAIPVEQEVEIFDGTHFRLANEGFVFHIE